MTADGLLVCTKDNNLSNKYLNSALFVMVFLVRDVKIVCFFEN